VVIREFNIVCITIFESETYAPLIVDRNGILPFSSPLQFVKSITRGHLQILQPGCVINIFKPPRRPPTNIRWKSSRFPCLIQFLCMPVGKRLDHILNVICHVTRVNRGVLFRITSRLSCGASRSPKGSRQLPPVVSQSTRFLHFRNYFPRFVHSQIECCL
jgi:hypothetical protein